jgi:hypothetical protein
VVATDFVLGLLFIGHAVAQEDPQQRPEQASEEHCALSELHAVRREEVAPPFVHELLQEGQVLCLEYSSALSNIAVCTVLLWFAPPADRNGK